jgi:Spy/CpxP family protein refolding chaperone
MIKKIIPATLLAVAGLWVFGAAAQSFHRGREQLSIEPFEIVLTPQQRQAILSLVKADRTKLQLLHERLHQAREALIEKLLSPDAKIDVSQQLAELKSAQAAMIDERVTIALKARKMLTAQQLKNAAAFHSKLQTLHEQEAALLQQMQNENGKPAPGADE